MTKPQNKRLTEQVRQAMQDSGLTRYRISKETGISEATLSKFHLGQRGLSMDAMDKLGECLRLKIVVGREPEKRITKPKTKVKNGKR